MDRRTIAGAAAAGLLALLLGAGPGLAETYGTKDDAVVLVERAVTHLRSVGREKAFADFSDPKGAFVDRDLYVFVADEGGLRVAHGLNPKLVGKSLSEAKDVNAKPYGQEIMDLAKAKGSGWVDYTFSDPTTRKLAPKTTYVKAADSYVFGVGVYSR